MTRKTHLTRTEILKKVEAGRVITEPDASTRRRLAAMVENGTLTLVRWDKVGLDSAQIFWYRRAEG